MLMFLVPRSTQWRIAGSHGVDVQAETPILNLAVGASYMKLPLDNDQTGERLHLQLGGTSLGAGVGQSLLGLVDVEFSLPEFYGDGLGRLVHGLESYEPIVPEDFALNLVLMLSVSVKAVVGVSFTRAFFLQPSAETFANPAGLLMAAHCAGAFYGTHVGLGLSAGVAISAYVVSNRWSTIPSVHERRRPERRGLRAERR
ncbi:MAG: hypothetical protein AAGF11_23530 [Myxococcota bacterium]